VKQAPRPRLYTTDEVAALTGRSAVTIKLRSLRFQRMGQVFGEKVGRQWLYTEDEIRDLAAIQVHRGRTSEEQIAKRKIQLQDVPLDQLIRYANSDDPEPSAS
jgi:hypothetical protein